MKLLISLSLITILTSCAGIVANDKQVHFHSKEKDKATIYYLEDSVIIPSMFKVTPKQKMQSMIKDHCPNGHEVIKSGKVFQNHNSENITFDYSTLTYKCKL